VTVLVLAPVPATLIVVVREVVEVLGLQVTTAVPLLLPLAGATVIQLTVSDTVQAVFEVMLRFWLPPPEVKSIVVGAMEIKAPPDCISSP
jgi:16S rRNA A1518/A1519 N6-dimethyltransferase RsmA/KsgA/DIM1 with predicted DNA glycosylase/AP lyase activity